MRSAVVSLLALALGALPANAQFMTGGGFGGGGGGSGGGGGGSVNNIATTCPVTTLSPSGGTITFPNGFGEVAETTSYAPTAAQCGAVFTSTGSGITVTLPTIGVSAGDVESPYGVTIKNADTSGNSVTVSGGGANINYNGSTSSSITLNAGQSTLVLVNAANTFWQATSTASGTVPVWHPGYISGQYYDVSFSKAVATGSAQTASTVYCTLQQLNVTETFKSMGAYFSTGVASGNVSYAMFNASAGRPTTLIDYAGPVAAPTSAGASTASLHNTTDTLTAGVYFFCETQDNTTGIINSVYNASFAYGIYWIGTTAPTSPAAAVSSTAGISCTAASTCGTGYAAWVGGAFTWASFTNPTWSASLSTVIPLIEVQAN